MEATALRYELSGDKQGLKKWFRGKDEEEHFYHVHSDEMTELEQWIHGLLSCPNTAVRRDAWKMALHEAICRCPKCNGTIDKAKLCPTCAETDAAMKPNEVD